MDLFSISSCSLVQLRGTQKLETLVEMSSCFLVIQCSLVASTSDVTRYYGVGVNLCPLLIKSV